MLLSFREAVRRRFRLLGAHSPGGVDGAKEPTSNLVRGDPDSDRTACAFASTSECLPPVE